MKKLILAALMLMAGIISLQAAVSRAPKIMILPSEEWCRAKGYVTDGNIDYDKALADVDMDGAVAVMGDFMAEEGFNMFSLKQHLKQMRTTSAYGMVVTSKGGGMYESSARDLLTRDAGVDFIVELSLVNKPFGVRRIIEFKAQTIDASSNKILYGEIGTSQASNSPTPIMVRQVIEGFKTKFCERIITAFEDIETYGREGSIIFRIADDCPLNFESEITVDGESGEFAEYIEYWLGEHAVSGSASRINKSPEILEYDQVRYPLTAKVAAGGFGSKKGKEQSMTMESFIAPIANDLKPFNVSVSTTPIGQGTVYVTFGGL
ncbi:MAG: hypothetical protein K2I48_08405 [Muribaculaceae bacterium]|nr:hypothetical protein [Muribaculaceae bacterium]